MADDSSNIDTLADLLDLSIDFDIPGFDAQFDPTPKPRAEVVSLKVGDKFGSLWEFKDAVVDQAIKEDWEPYFFKKCRKISRIYCYFKDKGCPWYTRCTYSSKDNCATVTVWKGEHNCWALHRASNSVASRLPYLIELVPRLMEVTRKTPITALRDQILRHTGKLVQDRQLYRVKSELTKDEAFKQIEDFAKLPIYLERLHKENRNHELGDDVVEGYEELETDDLVTDLLKEDDGTFKRIFVGPHTSDNAFTHNIPFIALDATYLRNCFKQTLLLAVGRSGNNESMILAWAIVESENDSSWDWFVKLVIKTIPTLSNQQIYSRGGTPCVISDRNPSLLKAIEINLPAVTSVWCCWHLLKNVLDKARCVADRRAAIKEAFWKFVYSRNENDWARARAKMMEVGGPEVCTYLDGLDKSKFCVWKVPGPRYGHNSSGIVESQNSHIRELREMGILELLDSLWTRTSRKRQVAYEASNKWMEQNLRFTPFASKKLMANVRWSKEQAYRAIITAHDPSNRVLEARVITSTGPDGDRVCVVSCYNYTCSCRQFQEWGLPCSHACVTIRTAGRQLHEFIKPWWEPCYVAFGNAYYNQITGPGYLNQHLRAVKVDDIKPDEVIDEVCKAPAPKPKKAGQNQKKRKEAGDAPEREAISRSRCSRCGRTGHNARNKVDCPMIYVLKQQERLE